MTLAAFPTVAGRYAIARSKGSEILLASVTEISLGAGLPRPIILVPVQQIQFLILHHLLSDPVALAT